MSQTRARILASAGLIAGLALGSIAISSTSVGNPWAPSAALVGVAGSTGDAAILDDAVRDASDGGSVESRRTTLRLPELVAAMAAMDVRDVEWQLHAGSTLAQVARGKGIAPEAVVGTATRRLADALDGDVASGRISETQKSRIVAGASEWFALQMCTPQAATA
jgi:hypothetical protein